ncbi:MAG: hypothetical protein KKB37_00630 [Alphaproteobacteria bacterium]|nr:hypothetical protein [Alphaproteobacteria bacterium]
MNLQDLKSNGNEGLAFRTISSLALLIATALLVGSLIMAHSVNASPNSDRVTIDKAIT